MQHGLRQIVHQASELGLSGSDAFELLAVRSSPMLALTPEEWTESAAAELRAALDASFSEFGTIVKARQPGYSSYPSDNQDEWFRIKGRRQA